MSRRWMVIYPRGEHDKLSIASVLDYEQDEWALASLKRFDEEKEAAIYAQKLSAKSGIPLETDRHVNKFLHILDLEDSNE